MFKKILIPIDGSESAHKAVVVAKGIAEKYGSEVLLLHVEVPPRLSDEYEYVSSKMLPGIYEHGYSNEIFNNAREVFRGSNIINKVLIEVGDASGNIVEVAGKEQIDLIVMGHRGLSGLISLFLGSVSKNVVNDAPCPVLVVR